jgi:membrane dipeptidase
MEWALAGLLAGSSCAAPGPASPEAQNIESAEPDSGSGNDMNMDTETRARAIHEAVLTLDSHIDIPFTFATEAVDPGVRGSWQLDIPKMIEGDLDAAFLIVYVGQGERTPAGYELARSQAMRKFDAIHRMVRTYPEVVELARTSEDVARIAASGRRAIAIGIENGWVVGRDLALVAAYHEMGARYITLAHNGHNDIADSASPGRGLGDALAEHGGISPFGERVIAEMNRVGIMVDVSHVSRDAMLDAVRVSRSPVIASHSSVRALRDVPRNMDDEQLRVLASAGGVVQIVAVSDFVRSDSAREAALAALRSELGMPAGSMTPQRLEGMTPAQRADYEGKTAMFEERRIAIDREFPPTGVSDLVDHIDYAVRLIGVDHVGISSDFDGGGGIDGWSDASETFNVTLELVRRGYSEEDIERLWGGNLLRVWRETERVAAESPARPLP